jgi:hypothetical protein
MSGSVADAKRRAAELEAASEAAAPAEERSGERVSFYLDADVVGELRGAADALAGPPTFATLSAIAESALRRELERLRREHHGGKPFPTATSRDRRRRRARLD